MPIATPEIYAEMLGRAKENAYAFPAINCTSSETINAAIKGFADAGSDGIIQFSTGGAEFGSGLGVKDMVTGAVALAEFAHVIAAQYPVNVALHTDHCPRKALPWLDGLLEAGEAFYKVHGKPLYSSHMIDLSTEPIEQNIDTCKRYLERMSKMGMTLEFELGITGGEEDGMEVDEAVAATGLDPETSLGVVPPENRVATVRAVAANAVMAGCAPRHLPVVVAAVRAAVDPAFNLKTVATTTHPQSPLVVVHGPRRGHGGGATIEIRVDGDACRAFAGRVIRGVKNGPSPAWLQQRLKAIGLRPINALVDITNYISFDRARPLHVFDAAKVKGNLVVRRAKSGEKLLALGREAGVSESRLTAARQALARVSPPISPANWSGTTPASST